VHKINSISDFIACAEFLIHERYTSPHPNTSQSRAVVQAAP